MTLLAACGSFTNYSALTAQSYKAGLPQPVVIGRTRSFGHSSSSTQEKMACLALRSHYN